MVINIADDLLVLLAAEGKLQDLEKGKSRLTVGLNDIILYEDNASKISVIKNGEIKSVI